MTRLLIATTNPNKLREIREVLAGTQIELGSLSDLPPIPEPDETGHTFQENARLKAVYYANHVAQTAGPRVLTVAEDSGLVVDALDGEPGVRSARFLRPDASYAERFAEIYRRLAERPERVRSARFICAIAVVRGNDLVFETTGIVEGEISETPRGSSGFGYDPIFRYPGYDRTLGEVTNAEKLRVAHRGHAFRKLGEWLAGQRT
jgi:XTP/dITP diphosphohydrolase